MFKKIILEKNGRNEDFGFLPDFGEKSYFSKNTNRYNAIHVISEDKRIVSFGSNIKKMNDHVFLYQK